jgi:hypothetical protein
MKSARRQIFVVFVFTLFYAVARTSRLLEIRRNGTKQQQNLLSSSAGSASNSLSVVSIAAVSAFSGDCSFSNSTATLLHSVERANSADVVLRGYLFGC